MEALEAAPPLPPPGRSPPVQLPAGPLSPGKRVLVHYFGGAPAEDVWHERVLLSRSVWNRWATCTPDDDVYVEDLGELEVVPLDGGMLPPRLQGAMVYRFAMRDQDARTLPEWRAIFLEGIVAAQIDRAEHDAGGAELGYDEQARRAIQLLIAGGWEAFDEPEAQRPRPGGRPEAGAVRGRGRGRGRGRPAGTTAAVMATRRRHIPASESRPRMSRRPASEIVPEDESSLYFIIRNGKASLQQTVDDWIDSYKADRDSALLSLMQFFISTSGCKGRITAEMQVFFGLNNDFHVITYTHSLTHSRNLIL